MGKWGKYCRNKCFGDIIGRNKKFKWMFLVVWAEISWQTACVRATNNQDYECCKFQRFSSVYKFTINLIKKSKIFAINKSFWKCEVRSKFPCGITFLRVFWRINILWRGATLERNWNSQNRINMNKFGLDKSWVTAVFPEAYSDLTLTSSSDLTSSAVLHFV